MSRLTRDGTAEPVSCSGTHGDRGILIFPVQLTTSRIGSLTRLIHALLYVMTIHTYIHNRAIRPCHPSHSMSLVCVLSSHLFWTSDLWTHQPGSHKISPSSFCGVCRIILSREGFSRPFPSSAVKSTFVYPRTNRPLVGHDFSSF